jgi:hypothetical protein
MMASPVAIMGAWWPIMEAGHFSMASRSTSEATVWGIRRDMAEDEAFVDEFKQQHSS